MNFREQTQGLPQEVIHNAELNTEKKVLSKSFVALLPELLKQKGSIGLELLKKVAEGKLSVQEFSQELEDAPDFQKFQELGLQFLEDNGMVEINNEGEVIVDVEKMTHISLPSVFFFNPFNLASKNEPYEAKKRGYHTDKLEEIFNQSNHFADYCTEESENGGLHSNLITFLSNTFKDKEVLSKKEWEEWKKNGSQENQKPVAKSLFYTPETLGAAFQPEQIKKAEFHIGPWEIAGKKPQGYTQLISGLEFNEASLAVVIYHPEYGNGERNKKGQLIVMYEDGRRKPITQEWIRRKFKMGGERSEKTNSLYELRQKSPQEVLKQGNFSTLQEKGLLMQKDFKIKFTRGGQQTEFSKNYGPGREIKHKKGYVTLNDSIIYGLGSEFADGKYKVVDLEPGKLAGIIRTKDDGTEMLTHTFRLFTRDELIQKKRNVDPRNNTITIGKRADPKTGWEGIVIVPYHEDEHQIFTDRKSGESDEEHHERIKDFDAAEVLRVRNEIAQATGINPSQLTLREQGSFVEYYRGVGDAEKNKVHDFIKKYKVEGLRVLSSLDQGSNTDALIFKLDQRFGTAEAALILRQYANLVKEANKVDEEIGKFFKDSATTEEIEKARITEEIMKRAEKLLVEFAETREVDLKEIIERITNEVTVFLAIFKTFYHSEKGLHFEDIQGLDFESKHESPNEEEIHQMESIIAKNYGKTKLLEGVLKGFNEALSGVNNIFYLLKHNGKVISFDRFEQRVNEAGNPSGEVEFASFNTDPAYQKSAIGTAMMEQTLEMNARENAVVADTDPLSSVCINYVEKQGFDIVGYQLYKDTGITVFQIRREKGSSRDKKVLSTVISFGNEKEVVENVKKYLDQGKKIVRYYKDKSTGEFFGVVADV
ncbi:MAG: hypothetical protein WC025_01785 [Candidatus Magasanikbacteria bacterium]